MHISTRRLYDVVANVYVAFIGSLASIVSLLFSVFNDWESIGSSGADRLFLICSSAFLLLVIAIYSIRVRQENRSFRDFLKTLHRINHHYRDTLRAVFRNTSNSDSQSAADFLQSIELKTLKFVCQKLAQAFTMFTHCRCIVTVKLITVDAAGKPTCSTCVRSEEGSERDNQSADFYEINTGANTAFDRALMLSPGGVSHFHSADLRQDKKRGYRNQRDHWEDHYLSAIVVPIRSIDSTKLGTNEAHDDVGFLCVDTLSPNRLNNTWHVELMAAFADQMYNFLSMMRGKYRAPDSSFNRG